MEEQEKRFKKDEKNGNNLGETQTLSVKILLDNDYVDAVSYTHLRAHETS